jgi:uncharacterized protein
MQGETNLKTLIKSLKPTLNEGQYVFCSLAKQDFETTDIILFFKEKEGITIICTQEFADKKGYTYNGTFAWLTLQIHSALDAVGLTAAFSNALAKNNISCNVIAGYYHDHIFVQHEKGKEAVSVLEKLSNEIE